MKTETVTDTLIRLSRYGLVNVYLVREDDGYTLIDTGLSGSADDILAAARATGVPIARIALTHGHGDHVGSLDALHDGLGADVPVLIPELDARILAGEKDVVPGKVSGTWPTITTTPDVRLAAGDRVGSLEVVATPGHSPGHVAFLDTRDRSVIAGDVFSSIGGLAVSDHIHPRFPLPGFATWDRTRAGASARAVAGLEPSLLVLGHGRPVRDPRSAIDRALAAAPHA